MKMPFVVIACALALATSGCGKAPAAQAAQAETLVVPAYPAEKAWNKITDKQNERQKLIEWIPADQTEANIKDILTEQAFFERKNDDPNAFVANFLQSVGGACASARVNGPKAGTENGYPVAYGQAYCVNQTGAATDVDIFIKAIGGHDALYVVQREFRRPTEGGSAGVRSFNADQGDEVVAQMKAQSAANDFLAKQVRLCAPGAGADCLGEAKQ